MNMKIEYQAIGIIHTPFTTLSSMPIQPTGAQGVKGSIEIFPQYSAGLKDLDGFTHIMLFYQFHQNQDYQLQVVPFLDTVARGVFATRAPKRPNTLGFSIIKLQSIQDNILHIENIDVLDGTPLIDIKPYVTAFDAPTEPVRMGWLEQSSKQVAQTKSDQRFINPTQPKV
jgi:tRNA (adenine37-N6)-methyltransferase